jgi:phosphoglycolate phosphatase
MTMDGRIRLVVFVLDGTLVDSRQDLASATNDMIRAFGGSPLEERTVVEMVGEGASVLVARALRAAGLDERLPDALERFLELYNARLLDTTTVYEGMREALDALTQRVALAVLTNKPQQATARLLDGLALTSRFQHVIGGDTPVGRKPDPGGLLDIVARVCATPESTVLVGDSPVDLHTARRAGTRLCLARYGFGFRFSGSDFRGDEWFVDRPADLPAIIEAASRPAG